MPSEMKNEGLFRVIFIFRKTLPSQQLFYSVFIIIKYIGPYLLTHNLKYIDAPCILFAKGISKLTLIQQGSTYHLSPSYAWISLFVFVFIILLLAFTSFIAWLYPFFIRDNAEKMKGVPSNSNALTLFLKNTLKCLSIFYAIIVLLSQHIVEYVFFGLFINVTHLINPAYYAPKQHSLLKTFDNQLPFSKTIVLVINSLSIVLLFLITYLFFVLGSTKTVKLTYGSRTITSDKLLFLFLFLFQFQGVYSIVHYFNDDYRNFLRLSFCIAMTTLLGIFTVIFIYYGNYIACPSICCIYFMTLFCFISGVIEIILYFAVDTKLTIRISITIKLIEALNPIFIIFLIYLRKKNNAITSISNRLFSETPMSDMSYFVEFFLLLSQYIEGKDVYDELYQALYRHFTSCNKETCACKCMTNKILSHPYDREKKTFIRILSLLAEKGLVQAIISRESHNVVFNDLLLHHVDYLQLVSNKRYLTLYICQYYLKNKSIKIRIDYAYAIYEVYRLIIHDMGMNKIEQRKYLIEDCSTSKKDLLQENKENSKKNTLLQNLLTIQEIKLHLTKCCNDYRRIIQFRLLMKTNKQFRGTCQDAIRAIEGLKSRNKKLHAILKEYLSKRDVLLPGEECYLLHCYFRLIQGRLPSQYKDRIKEMNSFTEIYFNDNLKQYPIIITSLCIDNVFRITYSTLSLIEQLGYTQKEILGSDIHDNLIYLPFAKSHVAQMKLFLVNGLSKSHRRSFIYSKSRNIFPVNVITRAIPSKDSMSLIIKFKPLQLQSPSKQTYFALIDRSLNVMATSSSFEKRFVLSQSILSEANIDLSQFFGINFEAQISKTKTVNRESQGKESGIDGLKQFQSIQTTIKPEDRSLYYEDKKLSHSDSVRFNYAISRRTFLKAIELLKKDINQAGIDKECIKNIEDLYNDISHSPKAANSNNKSILFELGLESKYIHSDHYYVVSINEEVGLTVKNDNGYNFLSKSKEQLATQLTQIQKIAVFDQLPLVGPNPNNNSLLMYLGQEKTHEVSMSNDKSQIINNSNLRLFIPAKGEEKDRRTSFIPSNKQPQKKTQQPNQPGKENAYQLKTFLILKILIGLLLFTILILDIIYLLRNSNSFVFIGTLFKISIASNLLSADLYYNLIGSLRTCLITNQLIKDDYIVTQSKQKLRVGDLILHYYQLFHYINRMNYTNAFSDAYKILYSFDSYDYMEANGLITQRQSNFAEEIYNLYFFLSNFDPKSMEKCRIKEIFYYDNYLSLTAESQISTSMEERTLFYMLNNLLTHLAGRLLQFDQEINRQIELFYSSAIGSVITWEISLSALSAVLYGMIIAFLVLMRNVMKRNMMTIFGAIEGEEAFVQHLNQYNDLLNNVCYKQCQLYESQRLLVDNTVSTTSSIMKSPKLMKKRDKGARQYASQIKIATLKEKEPEKQETENNSDKQFRAFFRLPLFYLGLTLSITGLLVYVVIQFIIYFISTNDSMIKNAQNHLSTEYLIRIPKLAELLIYSVRSVLANNQYHLTANRNEYDRYLISNHYNVSIDITQDSLISSLDDSYFAVIYYQYRVTSENILLLYGDSIKDSILIQTIQLEDSVNKNDGGFCINAPLVYVRTTYKLLSLKEAFTKVDSFVLECRPIQNGINYYGFKAASDSLLHEFFSYYVNYFKLPKDSRVIDQFFSSTEYSQLELSLQRTFKVLLNAEAFLVEEDIITSVINSSALDKQLSFLSIFCSLVFGFVLIVIFMRKMEQYNIIIEKFIMFFFTSIRCNMINEALL